MITPALAAHRVRAAAVLATLTLPVALLAPPGTASAAAGHPASSAQATILALSRSAYRMQTAHISRLKPGVYYGMGLFLDHGWIIQNPSLNGFNAVFAYLPPRHITIAVTTTLGPRSISGHNYSTDLTRQIARYLAPGHPIS